MKVRREWIPHCSRNKAACEGLPHILEVLFRNHRASTPYGPLLRHVPDLRRPAAICSDQSRHLLYQRETFVRPRRPVLQYHPYAQRYPTKEYMVERGSRRTKTQVSPCALFLPYSYRYALGFRGSEAGCTRREWKTHLVLFPLMCKLHPHPQKVKECPVLTLYTNVIRFKPTLSQIISNQLVRYRCPIVPFHPQGYPRRQRQSRQ
mmetsp:Transcript_16082/g.32448  ORF Transcript_16082/g.32448 Transcript_16082/m.32448 type:complete len:205 (-) Transcript_16082:2294-2908(-)